MPTPRQPSFDPVRTVTDIERLFLRHGQDTYGEHCTQLQHAQQSGTLALEKGLGEEFALAAFLHDIGHFLALDQAVQGVDDYGFIGHSELGADYLARHGFSARIVELVREHVRAKRYLCAVDRTYAQTLSPASTITLAQQGGPMSAAQVGAYECNPHLGDIIQLRLLDDSGKRPAMPCPALPFWLTLVHQHLAAIGHPT